MITRLQYTIRTNTKAYDQRKQRVSKPKSEVVANFACRKTMVLSTVNKEPQPSQHDSASISG